MSDFASRPPWCQGGVLKLGSKFLLILASMGYDMRDQWTQKLRDFQFHCSENLNRIIGTICRKHRSEISTWLEENIDNDLSFIGNFTPQKLSSS